MTSTVSCCIESFITLIIFHSNYFESHGTSRTLPLFFPQCSSYVCSCMEIRQSQTDQSRTRRCLIFPRLAEVYLSLTRQLIICVSAQNVGVRGDFLKQQACTSSHALSHACFQDLALTITYYSRKVIVVKDHTMREYAQKAMLSVYKSRMREVAFLVLFYKKFSQDEPLAPLPIFKFGCNSF